MDATPLISIVIPCYDQGHYVGEAIASVERAVTAARTEVIVVDDGSNDDTRNVAARSGRARVITQPNAGLAAARNRGLRECGGEYVVFLDADDRLAPGGLDAGLAALGEHPACAFVFGRCVMMSASGELLPTPSQPRIEREHYAELLRRNYIWMPAMVMFRREAVRRAGGFSESVNASADYELYLRIARTSRIYDHALVVAHYRRHTANMSGDAARMLRETLQVLRNQRSHVLTDTALTRAYEEGWRNWQDFYGTHLVNEIRANVRAGEWVPALRKTVTLGRVHPAGLKRHAIQKLRLWCRGLGTRAVGRRPATRGH